MTRITHIIGNELETGGVMIVTETKTNLFTVDCDKVKPEVAIPDDVFQTISDSDVENPEIDNIKKEAQKLQYKLKLAILLFLSFVARIVNASLIKLNTKTTTSER